MSRPDAAGSGQEPGRGDLSAFGRRHDPLLQSSATFTADVIRDLSVARGELHSGSLEVAEQVMAALRERIAVERQTAGSSPWVDLAAAASDVVAAQLADLRGRPAEAATAYERAAAGFGHAVPTADAGWAMREEGIALYELGRHEEALERLDRAEKLGWGGLEVTYYRGLDALADGRAQEAASWLRPVSERSVLDPRPVRALGQALQALGDAEAADWLAEAGRRLALLERHPDALAVLDEGLQHSAAHPLLIGYKAEILRLEGRYEESVALVPADCADAFPLGIRGASLWALGRLDEAEADLRRARELDAANLFVATLLADLLVSTGRSIEGAELVDDVLALDPKHGRALVIRGQARQAAGDLAGAEEALDRALELVPANAFALVARARVRLLRGRAPDALADLDRAVELDPSSEDALANRGEILRVQGAYDAALADLDRAVALDPGSAFAHGTRGDVLRLLGRTDDARAALERAVELDPEYGFALERLGEVLRLDGAHEEALAVLDRAVQLDPDSATGHAIRGDVLRLLGRTDDARAALERAVDLDADYVFALERLGEFLRVEGEPEQALAALDRAVALAPESAFAHGTRGDVLRVLGRHDDARAALERAVELDADYAFAFERLGEVLRVQSAYDDALAALDRAVALAPESAFAHGTRGDVLRLLGRHDEARSALERALELDPEYVFALTGLAALDIAEDHVDAALARIDDATRLVGAADAWTEILRGLALAQAGRFEDALPAYDLAVELDPGYAFAHGGRGRVLQLLRRLDDAEHAFVEAERRDPEALDVLTGLGDVYLQRGRRADAEERYRRALTLVEATADTDVYTLAMGAWSRLQLRDYEGAIRTLIDALTIHPDSVALEFDLALAMTCAGQHDRALEEYGNAIADADGQEPARRHGLIRTSLRDLEDAVVPHALDAAAVEPAIELLRRSLDPQALSQV